MHGADRALARIWLYAAGWSATQQGSGGLGNEASDRGSRQAASSEGRDEQWLRSSPVNTSIPTSTCRAKSGNPKKGMDPNIRQWFLKSSPDILGGVTTEHWVNKMTAAGIEQGLLNMFVHGGRGRTDGPPHRTADPGRMPGEVRRGRDDLPGLPGPILRKLQHSIRTSHERRPHGRDRCQGVRLPRGPDDGSATNCRPNDPLCFPIYTKCIELGIPVVINIGFPADPLRYARSSVRSISTTSA